MANSVFFIKFFSFFWKYFKIYEEITEIESNKQPEKQINVRPEEESKVKMTKPTIFKPVIREKTQMPKFIIVGVMKCGTRKWFQMISVENPIGKSDRWNPTSGLIFVEIISSAISRFLQEHPLLYDMGETYFFNRHYARGYVSISNVENWKKIFIHRIKKIINVNL